MTVDDAIQLARGNLAVGNISAAHAHWEYARNCPNAPVEAWLLAASHANPDSDGHAYSIALLQDAVKTFPLDPAPLHDLARAEEHRGGWQAAEVHWRAFLSLDGSKWWAFTSLARSLNEQRKSTQAIEVLMGAAKQFPSEIQIVAELARIKQSVGDWTNASEIWDQVISLQPSRWIGYRGKISTLEAQGRREEANALREAHIESFPSDLDALHDGARFAEAQHDWPKATSKWRTFIQFNSQMPWAYTSLANALCEQTLFEEAERTLVEALTRFPAERNVLISLAKISERRGQWNKAIERWNQVQSITTEKLLATLGVANALRKQAKYADADAIILEAIAKLGDHASLYESYGLNAIVKGDMDDALARFRDAEYRFPSETMFRTHIFNIELRCADATASAPNQSTKYIEENAESRFEKLVMHFESLGGGGHGCEFGIFQRHFGAEPLGLLRWADIYQDKLSTALETDFAGIGEPAFTNVFIPPNSGRPEYWTTDTRYHMAMRCFVYADEVPIEVMSRRVTKRLGYLRHKLLEDLRAGTKIFVYKNMKRNLDQTEIQRLHAACRRHGNCTLFYIRYSDEDNPNGLVTAAAPGLLIGYIDHFSHTPDTDVFIAAANQSLLTLCRRAYSICFEDMTHADLEDIDTLITHGKSLVKAQQLHNAEVFFRKLNKRFPNDGRPIHELARLADQQGIWSDSENWWRAFLKIDQTKWWAHHLYANALLRLNRIKDAHEAYDAGRKLLPDQYSLCFWYARSLLDCGHATESLAVLSQLHTNNASETETPEFSTTFATAALRAEDWGACTEAVKILERFPLNLSATNLIHSLQSRLIESGFSETPRGWASTSLDGLGSSEAQQKKIMMTIESLGGDYPGCEIGLIQRRFGAEPLSLLRWTTISPDDLISALRSQFAGVGTDAQTELYITPGGDYKTRDLVYGMEMLTFIHSSTISADQMRARSLKRISYLRQKLIDDLEVGEKLFAYRTLTDYLDLSGIQLIKSAMSEYGNNKLLYFRIADGDNPPGSLRVCDDGLMIGYVKLFNSKPVEHLVTDSWTMVVSRALDVIAD